MSEKLSAEEQEFEDSFNEFAGSPSADNQEEPIEDDNEEGEIPEEEVEDKAPEGEEEAPSDDDPVAQYKREVEEWKHKYNSDIGRVNAYQRKAQELEEELKRIKQSSQGEPGDNPEDSGMSDKEWEELKQDYPDIAKAFDSRLNVIKTQSQNELNQIRSQIQPLEQKQQEQYLGIQLQQLESEHPDWRDIVQTAEFSAWLNNQPDEIQAFMQSQEAQKNIYLLNSYKATNAPAQFSNNNLQQKRQKQLQQARTVPNRSTSSSREVLSEDDMDAAFEYYAKKKDSR